MKPKIGEGGPVDDHALVQVIYILAKADMFRELRDLEEISDEVGHPDRAVWRARFEGGARQVEGSVIREGDAR